MLTFYDNDFSTCAQKVRMLLCEKGVDWTTQRLDLRRGDQFDPEYLKINPNGVVPSIVHDEHVVIESSLILQYLDEALSPELQFTPQNVYNRYKCRRWMQIIDCKLHLQIAVLSIGIAFRHDLAHKSSDELQAHLASIPNPILREIWTGACQSGTSDPRFLGALKDWVSAIGNLESQLRASTWSAGEILSLSDFSLLPYIVRLDHLGILEVLLPERKNLQRWYTALQSRESFYRTFVDAVPQEKVERVKASARLEKSQIYQAIESVREAF